MNLFTEMMTMVMVMAMTMLTVMMNEACVPH